jgi:uncharacterized protein (TIGR02996 family)
MTAMRTRIRYRNENRNKDRTNFREIVLDGIKVMVSAGWIQDGATTIYERYGQRYATAEEARAAAEKQAAWGRYDHRDRVEDQVPDVPEMAPVGARNPELEAQVLAARDTPAASSVYADWLQTQGDPRGELAALWLAGDEARARGWLDDNAVRVWGTLDVKLDSELYGLEWQHGLLAGASLKCASIDSKTQLDAMTREFLALPVARLVTSLRFGLQSYESDNDWSETMTAVIESDQAAQLRSLRFDDYDSEACEISWVPIGDFSGAWAKLPRLETLCVRAGESGTLGDLDVPNLRTFIRVSGGLGASELDEIVAAKWPRLEHLEVWFGSNDYGAAGTPDHVAKLLERAPKTLRRLGLVNAEFTGDVIELLARSPATRQLEVLDLSRGTLLDADLDRLLAHVDAFRHLRKLDVSENLLNERIGELTQALPNVDAGNQRYDGDDARYVALGE